LLILSCVAVYFFVQPAGHALLRHSPQDQGREAVFDISHAAIPCEVVHDRPLTLSEVKATFVGRDSTACGVGAASSQPAVPGKSVYLALLYSMFLHGSLLHIGGNMLFLWIFGNNVEDRLGKVAYLLFYLVAGIVATGAHILSQPSSTVPVIGASGAIAGVMGAYLVLFPNVPITTLILLPPIVLFRRIRAKWLLIFWLASQFLLSPGTGVAWVAHVGGFAFGVVGGLFWRPRRTPSRLV
jgi:membrane associated rhomboid family serine protease